MISKKKKKKGDRKNKNQAGKRKIYPKPQWKYYANFFGHKFERLEKMNTFLSKFKLLK